MTEHAHPLPAYRDLSIVGAADRLDELAGWISDRIAPPWSRDL
jgi:hypothetical protein